MQRSIEALGPDVVSDVRSYLTDEGLVSETGRSTLLPVTLAAGEGTAARPCRAASSTPVEAVEAPEGIEALVAGPGTLEHDFIRLAEEGLQQGEIDRPGGRPRGAGVRLRRASSPASSRSSSAVTAIAVALGAAALFGLGFDLPFFIANIITMIGLAVGIDYSLLIVSRTARSGPTVVDKLAGDRTAPVPPPAGRWCSPA